MNNYQVEIMGVNYALIFNALMQTFLVPKRWVELHPPGLSIKSGHTGAKTKTVGFVATNRFAIPTYDPEKNYKKIRYDFVEYKIVQKPLTVHEEILELDRESEIFASSNINYPMYEYLLNLDMPYGYSEYYNSDYFTMMAVKGCRNKEFESMVFDDAKNINQKITKSMIMEFNNHPEDAATFMVSKDNALMKYNGMLFTKAGWQHYCFLKEKLPNWSIVTHEHCSKFIVYSPKNRRIVIDANNIEVNLPKELLRQENLCNF